MACRSSRSSTTTCRSGRARRRASGTSMHLEELFKEVPANKVILGIGNYAYDWTKGDLNAATLTYQGAVVQAKESKDSRDPSIARVKIDPKSLNPYYRYFDDADKEHI